MRCCAHVVVRVRRNPPGSVSPVGVRHPTGGCLLGIEDRVDWREDQQIQTLVRLVCHPSACINPVHRSRQGQIQCPQQQESEHPTKESRDQPVSLCLTTEHTAPPHHADWQQEQVDRMQALRPKLRTRAKVTATHGTFQAMVRPASQDAPYSDQFGVTTERRKEFLHSASRSRLIQNRSSEVIVILCKHAVIDA